MADGVVFSEDAAKRVASATKHYEQTYKNPGLKEEKVVRRRGGGCANRNEIWQITILGSPTGGTFDMAINVLGTTETLTFNWNDTATAVDTELDTHTKIVTGDVTVTGGPFPNAVVNIEFTGDLVKHRMPPPTIDFSSLTGGSGVGIVLARYQPGHPTDGSVAP